MMHFRNSIEPSDQDKVLSFMIFFGLLLAFYFYRACLNPHPF